MSGMTSATFDALKFANRMKVAGVPDKQAEAEAEALSDAREINLKPLVTEDTLRRELALLEQRLTIKFGAMIVAAVGVMIAVLRVPH